MLQLIDFLNESRGQSVRDRDINRPYDANLASEKSKDMLTYERALLKSSKKVNSICDKVNKMLADAAKKFAEIKKILPEKDFDCKVYLGRTEGAAEDGPEEGLNAWIGDGALEFTDPADLRNGIRAFPTDIFGEKIKPAAPYIRKNIGKLLSNIATELDYTEKNEITGAMKAQGMFYCLPDMTPIWPDPDNYDYEKGYWVGIQENNPHDNICDSEGHIICWIEIEAKTAAAKKALDNFADYVIGEDAHVGNSYLLVGVSDFNYYKFDDYKMISDSSDIDVINNPSKFEQTRYKIGFNIFDCYDSGIYDKYLNLIMKSFKNF